jgi:hypothetical protein
MSSPPRRRLRLGARALLLPALLVVPAHAQSHADAGARRHAAAKEPPAAAEHAPLDGVSTLKRLPKSAQLSEAVLARLERRAARRAANLPPEDSVAPAATQPAPPLVDTAAAGAAVPSNEPLRRGEAHQRRVQAVDTGEGVTVLSNRLVLPEPRLTLAAQRSAEAVPMLDPEPAPVEAPDEPALAEVRSVTETHSLRALAGRPATSRPAPAGLGWLVWTFGLLVLGGAVAGTLWFRKKTE